MKIIYRASNIVEAHIVSGMLKASGIEAYVGGHYLQGAVGDLSPLGFANVFVNDDDFDNAIFVVRDYEKTANDSENEPARDDDSVGSFNP